MKDRNGQLTDRNGHLTDRADTEHCREFADKLVQFLRENHIVGRANAANQATVAIAVSSCPREIQYAMGATSEENLIASSCTAPNGIFLCEIADDAAEYERNLDARVRGNAKRLRQVRAWMRRRREIEAHAARPPAEPDGQMVFETAECRDTEMNLS